MEKLKLKYKGKNVAMPIHFGWGALRHWTNATKKPIEHMQNSGGMTLEETMYVLWAGLKQGAYKAGNDFDLTIEDVADIMDENPNFLAEAMELFVQSLAVVESPNPKAGAAPRKQKASR